MTKALCTLIVASACVAACSQPSPSESRNAEPGAPAAAAEPSSSTPPPAATEKPAAPAPARAPAPETPRASAPAPTTAPPPPVTAPPAPVAAPPPPPVEPPKPKFREITIPAGTSLDVTLLSTLASNKSKVEDPVKGSIARPVVVSGTTVLPKGTPLSGWVVGAKESGRVKGRASVTFRFEQLVVDGETHKIQTAEVTQEAGANKGSDVKKGGVGAGLGAVVGGVIGGGSGAAIGAVTGGTAAVLGTKGNEIEVPAGTPVTVLLQEPLTLVVPIK